MQQRRLGRLDHRSSVLIYGAAALAGFVDLPGVDHLVWAGDQDAVVDRLRRFLAEARPAPHHRRRLPGHLPPARPGHPLRRRDHRRRPPTRPAGPGRRRLRECELLEDGPRGPTVARAAAMTALAQAGEILVSRPVRDLAAGPAIGFEPRRAHARDGVQDAGELFRASLPSR